MRISDWSSDVCSSDLRPRTVYPPLRLLDHTHWYVGEDRARIVRRIRRSDRGYRAPPNLLLNEHGRAMTRKLLTAQLAEAFAAARLLGTLHCLRHTFAMAMLARLQIQARTTPDRSEEHTSELQSLMRISYAVFCLKKKTTIHNTQTH